jgi:single-strand DNA-binding protein
VNEIYVSVSGRLVADPESRTTRGGVPFTVFRLASTVRRQNPQTREFEDAATSFFNVTAFRSLGINAAASLRRGEPVVVYGRMRVNQWMRQDNTPATTVEIDAYSIGHDLSFGTTEFSKVSRAQTDAADRMSAPAVQSAHRLVDGLDPDTDEYEVADDAGFGAPSPSPAADGPELGTEPEERLAAV